ncbi:MAG: DUF4255 domain-containing protein [Chitinophagales bacterium]
MIHEILPVIADELNEFFKLKFDLNEDKVILSSVVNQDGTISIPEENKVIVTLVNIEKDPARSGGSHSSVVGMNAPININLYVLFSAYFNTKNYNEALKFISGVIGFFQGKMTFDHRNTPMLPRHADKVIVELISMNLEELGRVWMAIGAKYLPSVLYRVRTISVQEGKIHNITSEIAGLRVGGLEEEGER